MKEIKNIRDLNDVVLDKYTYLVGMKDSYLSDTGHAAKEAYRVVLWYLGFHGSIEELIQDEDFMNLVSIPGKNPEYYKILKMINKKLEELTSI